MFIKPFDDTHVNIYLLQVSWTFCKSCGVGDGCKSYIKATYTKTCKCVVILKFSPCFIFYKWTDIHMSGLNGLRIDFRASFLSGFLDPGPITYDQGPRTLVVATRGAVVRGVYGAIVPTVRMIMSTLMFIYSARVACDTRGMSGAIFKTQNQAPRVTPGPLFRRNGSISLGAPDENFTKNHPTFTTTQTPEVKVYQEPQSHGGSLKRSQADELVSENLFHVAPAAGTPVTVIPEVVRKGEYHPGYAEEMLQWFDKPKVKEVRDTYTWKSGAVTEKKREVPATPPHFSEFARSIGVTTATLKKWARAHEEFGEAYQTCQEIFEEFLIDNGLTGAYGAIAMKFVAVNRTKMKDKVVSENITLDINKVLDGIAAGKVKPGGHLDMPNDDI